MKTSWVKPGTKETAACLELKPSSPTREVRIGKSPGFGSRRLELLRLERAILAIGSTATLIDPLIQGQMFSQVVE